jgi:hypothetical protein
MNPSELIGEAVSRLRTAADWLAGEGKMTDSRLLDNLANEAVFLHRRLQREKEEPHGTTLDR